MSGLPRRHEARGLFYRPGLVDRRWFGQRSFSSALKILLLQIILAYQFICYYDKFMRLTFDSGKNHQYEESK